MNLLDSIVKSCDIKKYEILKTFNGSEFTGTICKHPFEKLNFSGEEIERFKLRSID